MLAQSIDSNNVSLNSAQLSQTTTIAEHKAGTDSGAFFPGQSITTGDSSLPWNNITFSWFADVPAKTPSAFGTLFLLSVEYLGTPDRLSPETPGFIAQTQNISGGQYHFDPSVTLQPNTRYFFYVNASAVTSGAVSGAYAGGNAYAAFNAENAFAAFADGDANFRLSGTPIQLPAP